MNARVVFSFGEVYFLLTPISFAQSNKHLSGEEYTSLAFNIPCKTGNKYAAVFPDPVFALAIYRAVSALHTPIPRTVNTS
jgi:hypothetical protein